MDNESQQPLNVQKILVDSVSLFLNNFSLLILISLIGSSFTFLNRILNLLLGSVPGPISFLLAVPAFFISYWSMMALTYAVAERYQDRSIDIKQAFIKGAEGRYWKFIGVSLALMLMVGIGFVLLVLPGLYLVTIFALVPTLVILENQPFIDAFKKSKSLVQGQFWRVLGIVIVTFLFAVPLSAFTASQPDAGQNHGLLLINQIYNDFYTAVATVVYVTLYYHIIKQQ